MLLAFPPLFCYVYCMELNRDAEGRLIREPLDVSSWQQGPPHDEFAEMRAQCPVHFVSGMQDFPEEDGFWSLTLAEHIREVSLDFETFSSERGGILAVDAAMPLELQTAMFIAMDPPRHDRLKALFQKGFTPRRISEHEQRIRDITVSVLDTLEGQGSFDLVSDLAQPVVARVIGSFMGIPPEDDLLWAGIMNSILGSSDPDLNPEGVESVMQRDLPEVFERCRVLIEQRRRHPTDDLTSVLVHAEVEGGRLEEHEIIMGFFLLMAAGNDSTKATFCSAMLALIEHPEERQKLLDRPELIASAVEESLRMFPAFSHFRRTATRNVELGGETIREGDKVVLWYLSSNRDEAVYDDPHRFDVERNPQHQAFGAGGRHFCLGAALARLELRILLEETLRRYPSLALDGSPEWVASGFVNQLKSLPVRPG